MNDVMPALEAAIRQLPQVDLEARHLFAEDMYARVLHIPANVALVGKRHRKSTINVLLTGEMVLLSDHGRTHVTAPHWFVSGADVSKGGYAVTDCLFFTCHRWDGPEDVEMVEESIVYESLLEAKA